MKRYFSPLLGLSVFSLACGYLMTLIPLRLNNAMGDDVLVGYMGGVYYLGLLAGSFRTERTVTRVGHIRSFAAFMALLCSSVLSLAVFDAVAAWFFLRFLNGLAVAGIFVVVESWLLCESDEKDRGRVLAFYMVALYGSNALGQLFVGVLDSTSYLPFFVVGILFSLSILPPALTRIPSPELSNNSSINLIKLFKLTPSAMIGCLAAGMVLGALYSLLPVQLMSGGSEEGTLGLKLGITMLGGMLLQYPVGQYSDSVDRRKVLVAISLAGCLGSLLYVVWPAQGWFHMLLLFLIGGTTFTLYPLAISHGCDHLKREDIIAGTQGLLLGYSSGSCIGPVIAGYFLRGHENGLMIYFAIIMGLTGLFFLVRIPRRPAIYSSDNQPFVPVPTTTPVVTQIDPRNGEMNENEIDPKNQTVV